MRNKKIVKRIGAVVLAATMLTGVLTSTAPAEKVYAANYKNNVALKLNKQYTKYDITGDAKADKIKITYNSKQNIGVENGAPCYQYKGLKVIVNGKEAYMNKECYYYNIDANIITLDNGKPFLFLSSHDDNDYVDNNGIYEYSNGKLKIKIDGQKVFGGNEEYCFCSNMRLQKVSKNSIKVSMYAQLWETGGISLDYTYKYTKGKLVLVEKNCSKFTLSIVSSKKNVLTAAKSITVYKKTDCKNTAFKLKKNDKVKIIGIHNEKNNLLIKVKNVKTNKIGYIKCLKTKTYIEDNQKHFKEVQFAG